MAEKEDGEETEGTEDAAPAGKSKKKLIIIIAIAAVVVLGGAVAAFVLLGGEKKQEGIDAEAEQEVVYERADLGDFTVNLSSSSHFLKVKLVIEYDPELIYGGGGSAHKEGGSGGGGALGEDAFVEVWYSGTAFGGGGAEGASIKGLPGVLGEREPMVRDAIIRVLSSKSMEDVLTEEGKETLKEEILQGINETLALERDAIVAVYFQEFLVQ